MWSKAQKVFVEPACQNLASANPGKHVFFSALAPCCKKSIAIRPKVVRSAHGNRECMAFETSVKPAALFLALANGGHLFFHRFLTPIKSTFFKYLPTC
jgi:hypothetical protein